MHPYVFETASYSLRWETVATFLGIFGGLWLAHGRAAHKGAAYQIMLLDLGFWLVLAGLAGGRVWEMLFTWEEYADKPWDRLAIWKGGMSIQGAVIGGLVAALIFAWRRRVRIWELLDILAPAVVLGQGVGRFGCLMSGDSFGRPISEVTWLPSWLGVTYAKGSPAWSVFGETPLVPAEGWEIVLDFMILGLLLWYKPRRNVHGRLALVYAILYSVARFTLEFLRADSLRWGGLKVAQLLSAVTVLVCTVWLWIRYRQTKEAAG